MKKLSFLTSMVALTFAVPAMAVPSNTSSTFPSNGVMEEDYTYQNQATVTNLKVSSGTATTTANYAECPTAFPNSDEGAESTDECYTACTVSDFPAGSHIASVTGKNYQGSGVTDTCAIATCDTGYHLNPGAPNLTEIIGVTEAGTASAFISKSGTTNGTPSDFGITANNTWGVDYGTGKGKITGKAISSSQNQNGSSVWDSHNLSTSDNVTADGGSACWCKLDSYISSTGVVQSISAPWALFTGDTDPNYCAHHCAEALLSDYENYLEFRSAVFASIDASAPSCDANEISITWADASAEDIAANDAGSVTYGGDIRTPKKAVHKPGKIFTGWTFNTPSGN